MSWPHLKQNKCDLSELVSIKKESNGVCFFCSLINCIVSVSLASTLWHRIHNEARAFSVGVGHAELRKRAKKINV